MIITHQGGDFVKLGESLEDYLETLLILEKTGKIRCVDVAERMHVSKPSVNKAMNVLKEKGYVQQESYGAIHLTQEGHTLAENVYYRHRTISSFLSEVLGVAEEIADEDACHIEHMISEETFEKMVAFYQQYKK